jgi:hypothetical protein
VAAMVLRYLPEVQQHLTAHAEESIQKKRKGRKSQFLFTAQLSRKTNLAEIFSESRSGTIAHKNKKRITAVTHFGAYFTEQYFTGFYTYFLLSFTIHNQHHESAP